MNGEKGLRVNGKAGSSIAAGSSPNAGAQELYDLVTSCCPRPPVDSASLTPLPRTNSFRVASWHLTDMSTPKAKNTAVREVLCLTLLENNSGSMRHFNGDSPHLRRECRYSGISGIVRKGLTHLAIPDGWNWGGPVSLHCPVWAQVNPLPTSASIRSPPNMERSVCIVTMEFMASEKRGVEESTAGVAARCLGRQQSRGNEG
ncbi:unnamed protein product [Nesidiocoris tenuis]|uniref:Uncharacterized protein n=1 Tax=Nesidiocoris tenuis TaxID=355587 RepID=A0A6H5G0S8_9HEMI|nr:unnamed protein product [Nesidiocoris tenuis]